MTKGSGGRIHCFVEQEQTNAIASAFLPVEAAFMFTTRIQLAMSARNCAQMLQRLYLDLTLDNMRV